LNLRLVSYLLVAAFLQAFQFTCPGQSAAEIREMLEREKYEQIRVIQESDTFLISLENRVWRWQVTAVGNALDKISALLPHSALLRLLILERGIPRLQVTVSPEVWNRFTSGEISGEETAQLLTVSEDTENTWHLVRHEDPKRRSAGNTDLTAYPQLSFENTLKSRLYTGQLNIAPALQVTLWQGGAFTGQVIFPLYNELGYEGNFIRPGQVVLSQDFRVNRLTGRLSAGNFSAGRYGTDASFTCLLPDEMWKMKLNAGYTGSSHFYDNRWNHSRLNALTWSLSLSWFIPRYSLELEGGIRQYVYGDAGIFCSMIRWFGETAFGFYALKTDQTTNGGFRLTVPFPFKKRPGYHLFRVTFPGHQDMVYNAGTEFHYGQTYRTEPGINLVDGFWNARYIKNFLLKREN